MRFWFDTEFYEDGQRIWLISIGVVAEDGREYYAELHDGRSWANATPWLRDSVLPHLHADETYSRDRVALDLIEFMGDEPEIWAYYAEYDWVALCQLFGTMMDLPKGWPMYCRDIKQWCDMLGNPKLPPQSQLVEHNAIADARWNETAWRFLLARSNDDGTKTQSQPEPDLIPIYESTEDQGPDVLGLRKGEE